MIDEPYRWVEAIANRREYIEHQLAAGSPIVAMTYTDGILLFALSRERQKVFEIYDRIALGGIGHPGDIERLRMAAIELCSTEGFARSAHDVSLRRLANYSLSPALKAAFEQVYGAPYLARLLFAELGRGTTPNLFLRLDYDGSIHTNGGAFGRSFEEFGAISGTAASASAMEHYLRDHEFAKLSLNAALNLACNAWAVGHLVLGGDAGDTPPTSEAIAAHRTKHLTAASIEAAVLERSATLPMTWRSLPDTEVRPLLAPTK
jgi:proteasome alpha subunit